MKVTLTLVARSLTCVVAAAISLTPFLISPKAAQCDSSSPCSSQSVPPHVMINGQPTGMAQNSSVKIYIGPGFSSNEVADIKAAFNAWAGNAAGVTFDTTNLLTSDPGPVPTGNTIRITSDGTGDLADTVPTYAAANSPAIVGASTAVNKNYKLSDGSLAYSILAANADAFFAEIIAHEIGHALGFDNFPSNPSNNNQLTPQQGTSVMSGYTGTNNNGSNGASPAPLSLPTNCDKTQAAPVASASLAGDNDGDTVTPIQGSDYGDEGMTCYNYDDWDDETNTLTNYSGCY